MASLKIDSNNREILLIAYDKRGDRITFSANAKLEDFNNVPGKPITGHFINDKGEKTFVLVVPVRECGRIVTGYCQKLPH